MPHRAQPVAAVAYPIGTDGRASEKEPADAEPPKPRLRRHARAGARRARAEPEPRKPNVETIAAEGLRWVNIERPTPLEQRLAGGALRLPRPRPRGRALAQPAPEDRRVRRLPVHRPALPGLRPRRRAPERRRAGHLRRPRLPDHDPEPAAAAGRVPVRALPREGGAPRPALLAGLGLPALPDRRRRLRLLLPDAAQDRQQARRARGGDLRGPLRGDRARHLQRQAGDHQLPQGDPPAAHGAARPRAASSSRYLAPRGATWRSTSTTSSTLTSGSGTCSRTTRRSWRRWRTPTSR